MRYFLLTVLFAGFTFCFANAQCPPAKTSGVHIVQKGETLYRISKKYNVTVDQLRQWNNLSSDAISVCQELKVTTASPATTTAPATSTPVYPKQSGPTHIVQRGETIASIARLYGYTEPRFRQFNNLQPGQEVTQGMVLKSDDCQCPELVQPASEPIVGYENSDQTIRPTSIFSSPQTATQPVSTSQPNTQPDGQAAPGAPTTTYTPAEEVLADRKDAPKVSTDKTPAVPAISADFKPIIAPYMAAEERAMADEINLVRTNPAGYIPIIESYKQNIQNGSASGSVEACDELIGELKNMKPLSLLEPAQCIYEAAKKHGEELRTAGALNHKGADGSWPWDRVQRACPNMKDGNENFIGGVADVRNAVVRLLVDSEVSSRGHRRIMLNKDWQYIACYKIGKAGVTDNVWLQQFGR